MLRSRWQRIDWDANLNTFLASAQARRGNDTAEGVEVATARDSNGAQLTPGAKVLILDIPEWLVHDLPEDERDELIACKGAIGVVQAVPSEREVWIGIGKTTESEEDSHYSGHSFAIDPTLLKLADC